MLDQFSEPFDTEADVHFASKVLAKQLNYSTVDDCEDPEATLEDLGKKRDELKLKSHLITFLLWLPPFGLLGLQHLYLGRTRHALYALLTLNFCAFGWLFELCVLGPLVKKINTRIKSSMEQYDEQIKRLEERNSLPGLLKDPPGGCNLVWKRITAQSPLTSRHSIIAKLCVYDGKTEDLRSLLAKYPDNAWPLIRFSTMGNLSLLHLAAHAAYPDIVRMLITTFRFEPNKADNDPRNTPVHIACEKDQNVDIVRILVREFGANPRAKNNQRSTPLHIATTHGNLTIVKVLVEELGAREDLYSKDVIGQTPFDIGLWTLQEGPRGSAREIVDYIKQKATLYGKINTVMDLVAKIFGGSFERKQNTGVGQLANCRRPYYVEYTGLPSELR